MARSERSAGFILFCRNASSAGEGVKYLLLDYGRHWDFAKGHVHKGEADLAAALRELKEETGIAGEGVRVIPRFRHEIVYFFRDRHSGLVRKTVVFFLAESPTCDVVLSHEHVGFLFLPYEQALKKATYSGARQVLRAAHEHLSRQKGGDRLSRQPDGVKPNDGPAAASSPRKMKR